MSNHVIAGLGGSMREHSYSRFALQAALEIAKSQGAETILLDVRMLELPIFLPDTPIEAYSDRYTASINYLIDICRRSTGLIWASPTYHGTVSGAFKNMLDFLEFLAEDSPPYLTGRAVGLITISDPVTFGSMMNSVYELRGWCAPSHVVVNSDTFSGDGHLIDHRIKRRLTRLVTEVMGLRFEV